MFFTFIFSWTHTHTNRQHTDNPIVSFVKASVSILQLSLFMTAKKVHIILQYFWSWLNTHTRTHTHTHHTDKSVCFVKSLVSFFNFRLLNDW